MSTTFYNPDDPVNLQDRQIAQARVGRCDEDSTGEILELGDILTENLATRLGAIVGILNSKFKESIKLARVVSVSANPTDVRKCMGSDSDVAARRKTYVLPVGTKVSLGSRDPNAKVQTLHIMTPDAKSLTVVVDQSSFTPVVRITRAHRFEQTGRGASPRGSKGTAPDTGIS